MRLMVDDGVEEATRSATSIQKIELMHRHMQ
jgi:DNA-directed RNA polymerase sigma subunit (sigma70/sigma32)